MIEKSLCGLPFLCFCDAISIYAEVGLSVTRNLFIYYYTFTHVRHKWLVQNHSQNQTRMFTLTDNFQHLSGENCDWRTKRSPRNGQHWRQNDCQLTFNFADDIDGLARKEEELASLVDRLDKTSAAFGMEIMQRRPNWWPATQMATALTSGSTVKNCTRLTALSVRALSLQIKVSILKYCPELHRQQQR